MLAGTRLAKNRVPAQCHEIKIQTRCKGEFIPDFERS
jgi:hypothetical protein